jgi:hypothetical protein
MHWSPSRAQPPAQRSSCVPALDPGVGPLRPERNFRRCGTHLLRLCQLEARSSVAACYWRGHRPVAKSSPSMRRRRTSPPCWERVRTSGCSRRGPVIGVHIPSLLKAVRAPHGTVYRRRCPTRNAHTFARYSTDLEPCPFSVRSGSLLPASDSECNNHRLDDSDQYQNLEPKNKGSCRYAFICKRHLPL